MCNHTAAKVLHEDEFRALCVAVDEGWLSEKAIHKSGAVVDGSGSTGTMCVVQPHGDRFRLSVANVGDSRVIAAVTLTEPPTVCRATDHKPTDEGERRRIRAAGGWVTGGRVNGTVAVSRAFGDADYKDLDAPAENRTICCIPEVRGAAACCELQPGDCVLLCCDGIFEADMSRQEAADIASAALGPADCVGCGVADDAPGRAAVALSQESHPTPAAVRRPPAAAGASADPCPGSGLA
eukprot:gene22902-5065_t